MTASKRISDSIDGDVERHHLHLWKFEESLDHTARSGPVVHRHWGQTEAPELSWQESVYSGSMSEQRYDDPVEQSELDADTGNSTSVETILDDGAAYERFDAPSEAPEAPEAPEPIEQIESTVARDSQTGSEATLFCPQCGASMGAHDSFCGGCGWRLGEVPGAEARAEGRVITNPSCHNRLTALLLSVFLGWIGGHRFYVGKIGTALLFPITLGGFLGIWWIYDTVMIITGEFTDSEGRRLHYWQ